jgi:hypothetical protein
MLKAGTYLRARRANFLLRISLLAQPLAYFKFRPSLVRLPRLPVRMAQFKMQIQILRIESDGNFQLPDPSNAFPLSSSARPSFSWQTALFPATPTAFSKNGTASAGRP